MDKKVVIEFDVCWEPWLGETFEGVMADIERDCGAKPVQVWPNGLGGGWPTVDFEVDQSRLVELIEYMGHSDDVEFWLEQARPV